MARPRGDDPASDGEARSIRVLLAEDLALWRSALVSVLSNEEGIEVVADLKCDEELVSVATRLRPDVAVLDIDVPQAQDLAVVTELRGKLPESRVVVLTTMKSASLLRRLLAANIPGLIDKNGSASRLVQAVRGVAAGGTVMDANLVVAALSAPQNPLTPREQQVLKLAAAGATGPEIATELVLAPGTVRNYLSRVMTKTRARTRIEAIRVAVESGWM